MSKMKSETGVATRTDKIKLSEAESALLAPMIAGLAAMGVTSAAVEVVIDGMTARWDVPIPKPKAKAKRAAKKPRARGGR